MLDLKKLEAVAMPSKDIEIDIMGETQTVTISAMGDNNTLDIADLKKKETFSEYKIRCYVLEKCAGLSPKDAALLCTKDGEAAAKIISAILDLSDEFDAARAETREAAKKKSLPADTANMNS